MADFGRAMISKIIDEGDIVTALGAGVRADWFEDEEPRTAFAWMTDYHSRYGECPTERAFKTQFPTYRLFAVTEPYDYYIDHIRDLRTRAILVDSIIDANTAVQDDDPVKAQHEMSKGLMRLGLEVSSLTDENVVADPKARYLAYREASRNRGVITGIATGFPTLDMVTGGFHAQQLILLGGTAKQGKSFLLMAMAIAAQEQGKKVLFVSFEMSVGEQEARYDGITCGINSMKLLHGNLSESEFTKLKRGMGVRRNLEPFVISADISATTTASGLSGKIEQHQPDIVFIDGVYLMTSEGDEQPGSSQAYTAISRGLKRLAQRTTIPVVGTTQALSSKLGKDKEITLHSLGWTSAWSQDADLILGVERIDKSTSLKLRVVAGRNVSPREIGIAVNWEDSSIGEVDMDEFEYDDDD